MTPNVQVVRNAIVWTSGMAVDGDGAPTCYALPGSGLIGLDNIANAGHIGRWYGVVTGPMGNPIVQGQNDPAPGFCVSPTSLQDHSKLQTDPRRYVDASAVPYVSVPPELLGSVNKLRLGDLAMVLCRGKLCGAIVADVGPHGHYGEGSIALAHALELPSSPRNGGAAMGVTWILFRDTAAVPPWPRALDEIQASAFSAFERWGGSAAVTEMFT